MTNEIQHFIGLSDLKGLQYECATCNTRINASLADKEKRKHAETLAAKTRCPVCGTQWFQGDSDARVMAIRQFIGYLFELSDHEANFKNTGVGLSITLEIEPPIQ